MEASEVADQEAEELEEVGKGSGVKSQISGLILFQFITPLQSKEIEN